MRFIRKKGPAMWFHYTIDTLFSLALFINAALFIPQAIKIYRKKSAYGVSLLTFSGFCFIQLVTIIHGYLTKDYILMYGFLFSLFTCSIVTLLIIRFRN